MDERDDEIEALSDEDLLAQSNVHDPQALHTAPDRGTIRAGLAFGLLAYGLFFIAGGLS